jgi:hypothetical protein
MAPWAFVLAVSRDPGERGGEREGARRPEIRRAFCLPGYVLEYPDKTTGRRNMDRDVSAACQMFLIPSTILFTALANATTEPLKTLISIMGILTAALWYHRIHNWAAITEPDEFTARSLAGIFLVSWVVAGAVHAYWWSQLGWTGLPAH